MLDLLLQAGLGTTSIQPALIQGKRWGQENHSTQEYNPRRKKVGTVKVTIGVGDSQG